MNDINGTHYYSRARRWICEYVVLSSSHWFACVLPVAMRDSEERWASYQSRVPPTQTKWLQTYPILIHMRPSLYRCFVWRRGREWEGMYFTKTLKSHLTCSYSLTLSRFLSFSLPLAMGYTALLIVSNCVADWTLRPDDPSSTVQLFHVMLCIAHYHSAPT